MQGVEAVETKRSILANLAERLSGKLGFEGDVLPFAQVEVLREGGLELVSMSGVVEAVRLGHGTPQRRGARSKRRLRPFSEEPPFSLSSMAGI